MTITDFLLARIAEDEQWEMGLRQYADLERQRNQGSVDDGAEEGLTVRADRLHRECEAKRRIVQVVTQAHEETVSVDTIAIDYYVYRDVLLALALPYADHPDYREEWRP